MKEANNRISFVILGVCVDDIIPVSNNPVLLKAEKAALCERFEMIDQGEIHYILGMSIKRDRECRTLTISQANYVERILRKFGIQSPCGPSIITVDDSSRVDGLLQEFLKRLILYDFDRVCFLQINSLTKFTGNKMYFIIITVPFYFHMSFCRDFCGHMQVSGFRLPLKVKDRKA